MIKIILSFTRNAKLSVVSLWKDFCFKSAQNRILSCLAISSKVSVSVSLDAASRNFTEKIVWSRPIASRRSASTRVSLVRDVSHCWKYVATPLRNALYVCVCVCGWGLVGWHRATYNQIKAHYFVSFSTAFSFERARAVFLSILRVLRHKSCLVP